jgi:hypothetical protein
MNTQQTPNGRDTRRRLTASAFRLRKPSPPNETRPDITHARHTSLRGGAATNAPLLPLRDTQGGRACIGKQREGHSGMAPPHKGPRHESRAPIFGHLSRSPGGGAQPLSQEAKPRRQQDSEGGPLTRVSSSRGRVLPGPAMSEQCQQWSACQAGPFQCFTPCCGGSGRGRSPTRAPCRTWQEGRGTRRGRKRGPGGGTLACIICKLLAQFPGNGEVSAPARTRGRMNMFPERQRVPAPCLASRTRRRGGERGRTGGRVAGTWQYMAEKSRRECSHVIHTADVEAITARLCVPRLVTGMTRYILAGAVAARL